jgi:hypothetical protein
MAVVIGYQRQSSNVVWKIRCWVLVEKWPRRMCHHTMLVVFTDILGYLPPIYLRIF